MCWGAQARARVSALLLLSLSPVTGVSGPGGRNTGSQVRSLGQKPQLRDYGLYEYGGYLSQMASSFSVVNCRSSITANGYLLCVRAMAGSREMARLRSGEPFKLGECSSWSVKIRRCKGPKPESGGNCGAQGLDPSMWCCLLGYVASDEAPRGALLGDRDAI